MQDDAADDLHREVTHAEHPVARFAAHRKSVRQDGVGGFTAFEPVTQYVGLRLELILAHFAVFVLEGQHLVAQRLNALELPLAVIPEQRFHQSH